MDTLSLTSHPLCPFNQRLIITLLMKGLKRDQDFSVRYIDLANIPEWFVKISPRREMPVLEIDGENGQTTLFKTNPINEFLNESTPGDLHAEDPVEKARDRYWIEHCGNMLNTLRDVFTARQLEVFEKSCDRVFDMFEAVEEHLDQKSSYWRNQHYTLVDGAFIPAFTLMFHFEYFRNHPHWERFPNTYYWANRLLETSFAEESKCPDFAAEFEHFFSFTGSAFKQFAKV